LGSEKELFIGDSEAKALLSKKAHGGMAIGKITARLFEIGNI